MGSSRQISKSVSDSSDWSGTFVLGLIVVAGVGSYFLYKNLFVSAAAIRGAKRYFDKRVEA